MSDGRDSDRVNDSERDPRRARAERAAAPPPNKIVEVLDAHVHYWDPHTTPRAASLFARPLSASSRRMRQVAAALTPRAALEFIGRPDHLLESHLPGAVVGQESLDARMRVVGVVHVEAGWVAPPWRKTGLAEETRWLERLSPRPLAVVGAADLQSPHLPDLLDAHLRASPRFVGVRDKLAYSSDKGVESWCKRPQRSRDAAFRKGFDELARRDLSFDAFVYAPQLLELAELARAHPDTRMVLCHVGTPIGVAGAFGGHGLDAAARALALSSWREGISALAEQTQVHVKLSGALMPVSGFGFHRRATPPSANEVRDALAPLYEHALRAFGPERAMFASNFPMDSVSTDLPTLLSAVRDLCERVYPEATEAIFRQNAERFYGVSGR